MDPYRYARAVRQGYPIVLVAALVGGAGGAAYASTTAPSYSATSTAYFSLDRTSSVTELMQGASYTRDSMASYAELAQTPAVLDPVARLLGLDTSTTTLARALDVQPVADTVLLDITATTADPERSAALANAVAAQLGETARALSPVRTDRTAPVEVTTVSLARTPEGPDGPGTLVWTLAGLLAGLVLGVALVVLRLVGAGGGRSREETAGHVGAPWTAPLHERDPGAAAVR